MEKHNLFHFIAKNTKREREWEENLKETMIIFLLMFAEREKWIVSQRKFVAAMWSGSYMWSVRVAHHPPPPPMITSANNCFRSLASFYSVWLDIFPYIYFFDVFLSSPKKTQILFNKKNIFWWIHSASSTVSLSLSLTAEFNSSSENEEYFNIANSQLSAGTSVLSVCRE